MENNMIKSEFEIGKNYVKEFNIDVIDRNFPKNKEYIIELQIGFSNTHTDEEYRYANIFLTYNILLKNEEKELLKIYIKDVGEFRAPIQVDEDKFLEYCKFNGAPMMSQNIRAYLKAVTSLSDIEPVNLPMINFKEFFEGKNIGNNETV